MKFENGYTWVIKDQIITNCMPLPVIPEVINLVISHSVTCVKLLICRYKVCNEEGKLLLYKWYTVCLHYHVNISTLETTDQKQIKHAEKVEKLLRMDDGDGPSGPPRSK